MEWEINIDLQIYNLVSFKFGLKLRPSRPTNIYNLITTEQTNNYVSHLANDIFVSESNNQTVLWGVVLVLILDDKTLTGIVVRFAFYIMQKKNIF